MDNRRKIDDTAEINIENIPGTKENLKSPGRKNVKKSSKKKVVFAVCGIVVASAAIFAASFSLSFHYIVSPEASISGLKSDSKLEEENKELKDEVKSLESEIERLKTKMETGGSKSSYSSSSSGSSSSSPNSWPSYSSYSSYSSP